MIDGVAVLDASALVAWLKDEPGHEVIDDLLDGSYASTVNLAETVEIIDRNGGDGPAAVRRLLQVGVTAVPPDFAIALWAGRLRQHSARVPKGLALGDRFCLATAYVLTGTAVTADHPWENLVGLEGIPAMALFRGESA